MTIHKPQILDGSRLPEYLRERLQKAILSQEIELSETTEFYLVNLLTYFERSDYLFTLEPLAIMLARAMNGDIATQLRELKKIGDVSLYLTGLFADHLQKGPVSINYYIDMGSSAYSSLADHLTGENVFEELYSELSEKFAALAVALSELNIADYATTNIELLKLYERWLKTGNENIRAKLIAEGIMPTKKISC